MPKKYYVVWAGRKPGIYENWESCRKQTDGFRGARFKSFSNLAEAGAAFSQGTKVTPKKRQAKKTGASAPATTRTRSQVYDVVIYCDGGCEPNPGEAGSGIAVYHEDQPAELWYGLYNSNGTNNTAELNALHQSLLIAEKEMQKGKTVVIYCDSNYAINCISNWAYGWKERGWKKKGGEIKNLDIIRPTHALYDRLKDSITLDHVKGHSGIEGNELADRMTMLAIDEKQTELLLYDKPIDVPTVLKMRAD